MANKRKKNREQDDWEDEPDVQDLQPEAEVAKISLRDFMVPQKVQAFIRDYEPCNEGDNGYEQLDDARLREVFKAYVCGLGDTLGLYIEDLEAAGFRMRISIATGEPCLFARRRIDCKS
jgi:hypothetical protein